MTLNQQVESLRRGYRYLPEEDRGEAIRLTKKWQEHKRLSQLEQLRIDTMLDAIARNKEKTQWPILSELMARPGT